MTLEEVVQFIEIFGGVASVVALAVAIVAIKLTQIKEIAYTITEGRLIYEPPLRVVSDLIVEYKGRRVTGNLSTVVVKLKNVGNQPLQTENENQMIYVRVESPAIILACDMADGEQEIEHHDERNITFRLPLIVPRKSISLHLLVERMTTIPTVTTSIATLRPPSDKNASLNSYTSLYLLTTLTTAFFVFAMWEFLNQIIYKATPLNMSLIFLVGIRILPLTLITIVIQGSIYQVLKFWIKPE